jgi:hypothetical protein
VLPYDMRANCKSLHAAVGGLEPYRQYTLEDVNMNSDIKGEMRQKLHEMLFKGFLELLETLLPKLGNQHFNLEMKDLQQYYTGAGFNHTNENRFHHLENALWAMGYYAQELTVTDEETKQKRKVPYVYKVEPIAEYD